ncbi:MAG: type II toxin-antitoxin system VapC family toxin [Phycisphaerae bacterium]|nr:type II toxin-antitoxin system VapC family toxin [Phycisphaerae bacterium]
MMRVALDTNRYVDLCRGDGHVLKAVRSAVAIFLPWVVLAEIRAGFLLGSRGSENEGILVRFITSGRVGIIFPDDQTTHHYAKLFAQLQRQGTPNPTNDIRIAATVLQHKLALCSRDGHFAAIPQLLLC